MPYAIRLPDGTLIKDIPDEITPEQAKQRIMAAGMFSAPAPAPTFQPPPPPPPEGGFFPSVKRGFLQTGMLIGDVLPAMVGKAIGAEDYAKKQWEEAAETQKRIEREVPAAVPSYKDISGFGDAWVYAKEAVGESLASIIPALLTGGAAGLVARPAVAAANTAAREAAEKALMSAAMNMGPPTQVALEKAKQAAVQAGIDAAKRTAFRYEVAGGLGGSALQNIPEVYQNIKEETGKEDIPAALVAGGFNAALDSVLPISILKKIRGQGLSEAEVMAAWYKRGAKGLGKGFLVEGATEAAQEGSSILAENFVAENSDVFNSKNLERVINAGLKGGLGGGVITAATDIATGKAPPQEQTDRQKIEQLQREILGDVSAARAEQTLQEAEAAKKAAEDAEAARKEAERAPTVPELITIAQGQNAYSALEAEKQRLLGQQKKTKEVKEAIEVIKELQGRLVIEDVTRRAPSVPAEMDDKTIRSLGFVKSENPESVYQQLLGKSTRDPDVTAFLKNYAETKAKPQTKDRINTFLGRVERAQIPLTAEEIAEGERRAGETVTEPSGAGAPVVGEPGAGAPAPGVGIPQPSGVVPPVAPVGEPPVGERAAPAPVAPPPVTPPAAPPVEAAAPPAAPPAPAPPSAPAEAAIAASKAPSERQERIAFGKAIGAAQQYPGTLTARVNIPAQTAVTQNDFPGVVAALQKSKSPVVAEVANRARGLNTNIVIDEEAAETYAGKSPVMQQLSIDGAKMHIDALEKIRGLASQVDALPNGAVLPYSIIGETIPGIENGEQVGNISLEKLAGMGTTMFAQFPGFKLRTKEDFKALQKAFEDTTSDLGENKIRMTSTGSAETIGVSGVYDANTNTIRVPSYFAKNEGVLAHEIVHAQTVQAVANPNLRQKPVVSRLNKLYDHVKAELEAKAKAEDSAPPYGVASIQEFIAEGMSNPRFQFQLSKIKYQNTTAWDAFVEVIANLLGLKKDTAFTELLAIYSELMPPSASDVADIASAPAAAPAPTAAPTIITAEQLIGLGVKKTQPMIRRIAGKNMDVPADRANVLAELNKYINNKDNSPESRENLTKFRDQFEEVGKTVTVAPTKAKKPWKTVMGSQLLALVDRTGGLDPSLMQEFSTKFITKRLSKSGKQLVQFRNPPTQNGQLFRAGGMSDYVEIAELLEGAGYLEPGAVEADYKEAGERAKTLISTALNRGQVLTFEQQEQEARLRQEDIDKQEQAKQEELKAEQEADALAERQAIIEAEGLTPADLDTLEDNIPFFTEAVEKTPERLAADMRDMGFTEEEIADAVAEFSRKAIAAPAPETRAEEAAQAPAAPEAPEGLELEAPTAEELAAREKREADAREAEREEQKRLEQKRKADAERGEFVLTGSDRPADVAEAAGQMSIFGKPSLPEAAQPKPVKLSKETQAKIDELSKLMQKMLGKMGLKNVALNIAQDLERNGEYANRLITLALDATSPVRDLRHESLHAMKELGFFSDAQWATLTKMARDKWIDKYLKSRQSVYNGQAMSRYDAYMRLYNGNEDLIIEEAIADAFGDFDATKAPPGFLQTMLFRMREFFRNIREAMGAANIDSAEDIFRRVEKGELRETAPAVEAPARASLRAPETEAFKRWFGDSKVVDAEGKPLALYRGVHGFESISEEALNAKAREGYATFASNNPAISNTYANPNWGRFGDRRETGALVPVYVKANRIIEFPTRTDSKGWRTFDKFEFDRRAKTLRAGEVLVVRGVTDTGPRSNLDVDPERGWSYPSDIYAWRPGTSVKSATGNIGTYDVTKPDIRYSLRDATEDDRRRSLNDKRVSPRLPTAVKATEDTLGKVRLQPDLETFKRDTVTFRHNIGLMSKYPNFANVKGTPDQRAEQMIEHMKENLLWLFNQWDKKLRDRSKLWYVGGNRIAHRWAEKYGIPPEQAAAIIAALSPQKDWFQNVSLAERTLDALVFNADTAWTPEMTQVFRERAWAKKFPLRKFRDKTLKEMYIPGDAKSLVNMAVWIRAWDEATNPQTARVITPEGNFSEEIASGKTGKPIAMRAQSFAAMVKTLQMMQQTDLRVISDLIGKNHKVRSFYNNIIAPYAGDDVTIDTHAVAAALMRPLGSSDLEVYHNFGSAKPAKKDKEGNILIPASPGTKNSAITGLYGTYAMYAEAYRRAAKEANVLPREMQSITWEAIRGLFRPEQKQAKLKQQTNVLWNKASKGEVSGKDAREQISEMVSGITDPAWAKSSAGVDESRTDSSYATELPRTGVPGGRPAEPAGRTGERVAGAVPRASLRDAIGLYSELENKIAQGPNAAPAPQWKAYIKGLVQKGVKPEEIEWSGVNDWLDLQTGRVSKEALNDYLKQGGVRVEETVLGERGPVRKLEDDLYRMAEAAESAGNTNPFVDEILSGGSSDSIVRMAERHGGPEEMVALARRINDIHRDGVKPKYGKYTLPGGENYREVLLTLPHRGDYETPNGARFTQEELSDPVVRATVDKIGKAPVGAYRSTHWDQPNVLAHIRVNDRTDADGNRVLFVEEIQSDWGQEGKKKGFRDDAKIAGLRAQLDAATALDKEHYERLKREADRLSDDEYEARLKRQRELEDETQRLAVELDRAQDDAAIPSAPFVTKTEGWLNLALKRIMVMAAEGGYDKVAFVNGEQSAERFSLDKQVDELHWRTSNGLRRATLDMKSGDSLTFNLDKSGVVESVEGTGETRYVGKSFDEIVGKELAEKVLSETRGVLSGDGLKVGGEGMKAFYDTIVPTAVKKLLPKVGGGQMMAVEIPTRQVKKTADMSPQARLLVDVMADDEEFLTKKGRTEALKQPGFDVTPDMKQKVQTTGLPRFSLRDVPRANLRDQVDLKIVQRMDQLTVQREEKGFVKRITDAISPKNFGFFRQRALNRYEGLSQIDRMKIEKMGGADLLADASAESAALMSDMGAGITASALGVHDREGGAPVYKRYFVVEVNGRALGKQYTTKASADAAAATVNGVVRERGFTTVSNFDGTVKGPVAILAPLMAKYKDPNVLRFFQLYSMIKRGARLMYTQDSKGNIIEKLITADDVNNVFPRLEAQFPEFKKAHAEWIKYNDKLVEFMRDTGIISEQNAATFKMHGDYFPFYRQIDGDEDAIGPRIFQSIAAVKAPKKMKGSEIAVGDFLENMVRNTQSAVQAGIKNVASRRAAQIGMDAGIVDEIPVGITPESFNSFYVLENGLKKYYDTSDQLFIESIKSLNLPDMPFIGMLAGPANLLRNLVTKDPGFILANLMRDSLSAWATSGVNMTPLVDTMRNFGSALGSKSPEYEALLRAGVIGGYEFSQNVQTSAKEFGKSIRKAAGVPTLTEKIASPVTSVWGALEKATTASDAATRMEIYKKTLAETGNEAEALYRALEVMNFNRKGSSAVIRILTAAVPFLNARMQGLDILYRAAIAPSVRGNASDRAKQIQKTFFVRGSMIMALSAMYWLLTHDDEDYKKQEQETKDNYWLLPSLGIKIPIPFEVGVLFKVIPERILAYTMGNDTGKDFAESMKRQLLNTLAFNPIPQTFIPVVETVTNFSFFTWRPILPQGMENVAPEYQVGPGTSKLAEGIGKTLKLSPMKIDQLINGYTGTMGMYAVDLMDSIYNTMAESPKPSKRFEQMPVIKRFAVDPEARGAVTAYYDLKNAVDQVVRTENLLERTMDYENWGPYMQENIKLLAAKDYVNDMEKTLKEFREMKIMVRSSNMSADAKRDTLKTIGQMENALNSNIQELKKVYRSGP